MSSRVFDLAPTIWASSPLRRLSLARPLLAGGRSGVIAFAVTSLRKGFSRISVGLIWCRACLRALACSARRGLNVAAWNWNHRDIASEDGRLYTVAGAALWGFITSPVLTRGDHQLMLEKYPQKRDVIAKLMTSYRDALSLAGRLFIDNPWSFGQFNNAAAVTECLSGTATGMTPSCKEKYPDPWRGGRCADRGRGCNSSRAPL